MDVGPISWRSENQDYSQEDEAGWNKDSEQSWNQDCGQDHDYNQIPGFTSRRSPSCNEDGSQDSDQANSGRHHTLESGQGEARSDDGTWRQEDPSYQGQANEPNTKVSNGNEGQVDTSAG